MCSLSEGNSSEKITEVTIQPVGREVLDNAHSKDITDSYTLNLVLVVGVLDQISLRSVQNESKLNSYRIF